MNGLTILAFTFERLWRYHKSPSPERLLALYAAQLMFVLLSAGDRYWF